MKSPFQILAELNRTDEHARIEAKDSRSGQVGKSVYHTLSAFSNEPGLDGGYLLFGVARNDGQYISVGVADPDKLQTSLSSMCSEFNVPIRPLVEVEEQGGKCLVSAFIPEADMAAKPLYRKAAGLDNGAFRRNGSTDVHCTESDLQAFFSDRDGSYFDSSPVPKGATFDDLDPDAIALYRDGLKQRESASHLDDWSNEDLLKARKCLREADGELRATVAGLVLFGTRFALESNMWMSSRIDYIRVFGTDWTASADSMQSQKFWGPLVLTVPKVVDAIIGELPRRMTFPSDSITRTEEALIPRFVLREAVVNATMHRDYRVASSVQIIRYTDRIEIRNPGRSLKPADELGQGGSKLRNPDIAQILYQLQLAEAMGSGLHRIRTALAERDLPAPTFESSTRPERFVATFRFEEEPESHKPSEESHKTISEGHEPSEESHTTSELPAEVARTLAKFSSELRQRVEEARAQHRVTGVQELIRDVCSVQAFSATELAELFDRERSRLVRSHLKPLVEEGVLELTHPENPRHPKQSYKTVGEIE